MASMVSEPSTNRDNRCVLLIRDPKPSRLEFPERTKFRLLLPR